MSRAGFRSARRKADYEGLWLITFADLMVQLMAFFALAYSFTATDQQKFQQILKALRRELGVATAADLGQGGGEGVLPGALGLDPSRAADLERLLNERRPEAGPEAGVRLRLVSFRPAILFDEGSPALTEGSGILLERLSHLAREYPGFQLVCEGHAAPGERGRGAVDALELSGLRAQGAVRELIRLGMDASIMAAEAHGDSVPDGDFVTPEGRALQRRVTFRFQRFAER